MTSVLTLSFDSLFQSFGTNSISVHRDTDLLPTKSMVVGLILNSFGHDKYATDEESLNMPFVWSNKIRFATIQKSKGVLQKKTDFCSATRYDKKNQNDIIHKEYLIGSKFYVFLEGNDEDIETIAKSLFVPKRQLYIGRKCCTLNKPLCWDKGIVTISQNKKIEDLIFKGLNLFRLANLPNHIIECGNVADFSKKILTDEVKQCLDSFLGIDKWSAFFHVKRKTSPVYFGKQLWTDLLCYSVSYLRYGDLKEITEDY